VLATGAELNTYDPFGLNTQQGAGYWQTYGTGEGGWGGLNWADNLYGLMSGSMTTLADHYGVPREIWQNLLDMNWVNFMTYLDQNIWRVPNELATALGQQPPGGVMGTGLNHFQYSTQTPQGFNSLYMLAQQFFGQFDDRIRQGFLGGYTSGGGGSGAAGPTFDIEQLTQAGQNIWRGLLLDENPDIRILAQAYVDQATANPNQALDFTAFVRQRALATPRAKSIYRNKPEGMSEEDYIMQYYQAAMQISGPHNAEGIAIGGAQMQADPYSYQARLQRTAEYQSSSGFINGLEERLRTLSGVLGGR